MALEGFDSQIERGPHDSEKKELYWVIVFNNDQNTYEEVIQVIQKATHCSLEVAAHIAWEIDKKGKSKVMIAPFFVAKKAADLIGNIGIRVIVTKVRTQEKEKQ